MVDAASPHSRARARLAPPRVAVLDRDDGSRIVSVPIAQPPYPRHLSEWLRQWAREVPARVFLAERAKDGAWRTITYGEFREAADAMTAALMRRGHSPARPVAALSDNAINFALLMFGAMQAGIPFMPVSPAYSLMSHSFSKIQYVFETMKPSLVYVPAVAPFAKALAAVDLAGIAVLTDDADPDRPGTETIAAWRRESAGPEVDQALAHIGLDQVAKILLTSGSTGMPKGVINTQRMMCSNQAAMAALWPFLAERPPVLVDWLPWNHTFGANFCFNMILKHGGTLHIDGGRPAPGRFEATLRNLRDVQPTLLFNVPRGYDMLIPALEADEDFARRLFADLDVIFYAGAALPKSSWERLSALARKHRGDTLPIVSALGATETAPCITLCHWQADWPVPIGLPVPGIDAKLAPSGGKMELRVRGPAITPGYYGDPDRTHDAFDEEGYFKLGDAVKFVDPARPETGFVFDGRVSENFKLTTGTWVHVGTLRLAVISAAAPAVQDAVIAGHDRSALAALLFPNVEACRTIAGLPKEASAAEIVAHPRVRAHVQKGLARHNADSPGSSTVITRALFLVTPPAIDANEITDKGYINQRAVLDHRASEVARLYEPSPDPAVIVVAE